MNPLRLQIKPLSTNRIYVGRKVKSSQARQFERDIALLLAAYAKETELPDGDLAIHFRFGTTRQKDLSNNVKLLEDQIAKHYGIDDRRFAGHTAVRIPVPRGEEFVIFQIVPFRNADFPQLISRR